jgi:hypothetical protein
VKRAVSQGLRTLWVISASQPMSRVALNPFVRGARRGPDPTIKQVGPCLSSREPPLDLAVCIIDADKSPRILRDTERNPSLAVAIK